MTRESYSEAIEHLTAVVEILNEPGKGLGYAYGLRRGQAGYFQLVRARNDLWVLAQDLRYHETIMEKEIAPR